MNKLERAVAKESTHKAAFQLTLRLFLNGCAFMREHLPISESDQAHFEKPFYANCLFVC